MSTDSVERRRQNPSPSRIRHKGEECLRRSSYPRSSVVVRVRPYYLKIVAAWLAVVLVASGPPARATPPDEAVLSAGLTAIRERALLDLPLPTLTLEGMKGLSAIDPAFSVSQDGNQHLQVLYGTRRVALLNRPADNDVAAWAGVVRKATDAVAPLSPAIRQADQERLYQAFFDSSLGLMDVFSHFAGAVEARAHRAEREGFGGIGILDEPVDDGIVVTTVIAGTPAAQASLKVGDHITAIDGTPVAGLDRGTIAERLRGPPDSPVILAISHPDGRQPSLLTLRRAFVVAPTVTLTVAHRIATIAISSFNQNTAATLRDVLRKVMHRDDIRDVILDLRGNPGGLLDQGIAVADQFIGHGAILVTRGRHPDSRRIFNARSGAPGEALKLVVLVDGYTASAAEIVTAALQDSGRAVVIGTNTFGKGTTQTVVRLPDDGELTLTWSRFFAPSGYALHGLGVLPALCTSGSPSDPEVTLNALRAGKLNVASVIARWRSVGADDKDRRIKLRGLCPAQDHAEQTADETLARHLLADPALYEQALALTVPAKSLTRSPAINRIRILTQP